MFQDLEGFVEKWLGIIRLLYTNSDINSELANKIIEIFKRSN